MSTSIVFIESRVTGYQTLIDSFTQPAEVFILTQLQGRTNVDALHIISHGSEGALYLGNTVLNQENLSAYSLQLAGIHGSLTQAGGILLYGCNVAQGDAGQAFIGQLAELTGADVAASDDLTGAAESGGDWMLEKKRRRSRNADHASQCIHLNIGNHTNPNTRSFSHRPKPVK